MDNCGQAVAETTSDDEGFYKLRVPGNASHLKAVARIYSSDFSQRPTADGNTYQTSCTGGASWDFNIVDNTSGQALHGYTGSALYTAGDSSANLSIPLSFDATRGVYLDRSAAPFALADTLIRSLEQVCQADPATQFPKLMVNWSTRNSPVSGQKSTGSIGTSHFTIEAGLPQLYILGKENVDTDEYDSHVVAHEFGHYLEYSIYRSDTLGGSHSLSDRLDPRVAFGEGYGNAFSAMATGEAIYVDSMGEGEADGDGMNIGQSTKGAAYNGVTNEKSVQYLLWKLYQNNSSLAHPEGGFSKIHQILKVYQRSSSAFTTLLTFAAHYNAVFGSASESFRSLWETELDTPYDALCQAEHCNGLGSAADDTNRDLPDPFDEKGLIGPQYASTRTYGYTGSSSKKWPAGFWNLYRKLERGVNSATSHDVIDSGSSSYPFNKFGYVRWYYYDHAGAAGTVTVSVENLAGGSKSCGSGDWTDLYVYSSDSNGLYLLSADEKMTGCPAVSFRAEPGRRYLVTVNGAMFSGGNLSSYDVRISP